MAVRASAGVLLLVLLAGQGGGAAAFDLSAECPGNLVTNGGFEQPNTEATKPDLTHPVWSNSKWGWYERIPGWFTTNPRGPACVRVDWCGTCQLTGKAYIELGRGNMATPIEGRQYAELLPNATGNYCQELRLQKGARYKLSYWYGREMTYNKKSDGRWAEFDTAIDVAIRPSGHVEPDAASKGVWPEDRQGFTRISSADTKEGWERYKRQWIKHETFFEAPSNSVTLAFINTRRPKECESCGSLLDAVCLQKA